ncbi:MAG TPA: hypothetical protein VGK52_08815 [Polyangia bacterium]
MSRGATCLVDASLRTTDVLLAAVLACGLVSCGGKSAGPDAGGLGGGGGAGDASADSSLVLSKGACALAGSDCADGTRCDFFCDGQTASIGCRPGVAGAALGQTCSGSAPCAKGTGCLATSSSGIMCRKYCSGDADCPTGRCHVVNVAIACGGPDAGALVLQVCF